MALERDGHGKHNEPFLFHLDGPVREQLYHQARGVDFAADEILSRQGETASSVMIVDAGVVKVTVSSASGSEVLLGLYSRGELLGENSALQGGRRSASIVGHLPGKMLFVSARAFAGVLSSQPSLFAAMLATSAQRLRKADNHRLAYVGDDVATRVAATLLSWAREYGRSTDTGIEIGLRASRRELAQVVAASEKTVDDVLTVLRRAGLIDTGRRRFVVLDSAGLARWAASG